MDPETRDAPSRACDSRFRRRLAARCGQTAPSRTYSVTLSQITLPSGGGAATLDVATGDACTWTVTPTASWFAIIASPARTGSGSVQITNDNDRDLCNLRGFCAGA